MPIVCIIVYMMLDSQRDSKIPENSTNDFHLIIESTYDHPTLTDYYINLTPFITLSIFVAALLVILNISIFCTTVAKVLKQVDATQWGPSIFLCSLYPCIGCAALATILVPKAWLICHTVMHLCFTVGAVALRELCFRYIESEANYIKATDAAALVFNTPPCCCCCRCFPSAMPSKPKLCILRYMIWQMPFIQGSIMLVLNLIYYGEQDLYKNVMIYFMPFIVCSILLGIWALNIIVRVVTTMRSGCGLMKKMFCLQLILLLCKLQYMLLDSQLNSVTLGNSYPMNHTVYKQTIINLLILIEMVLVSILVQNAYKTSPLENGK
uniref:Organic solute transporter alpha-like protein n=1 Tax=Glossina pallidipes TaxID=7398 RepID=A0A1A9ZUB9_GLOPL